MDNYTYFTTEIKNICKIDLSNYKEKQMKRRINSLIKRNGLESYHSYLNLLRQSKHHLDEFLNYITINVSEFFRNPAQWRIMESEIIPQLTANKKNLRIWSSACSTGEEPYSLAILLKKMNILNNVYIIASDIDKSALEKAKQGVYSRKEMAGIPEKEIKINFTKVDNKFVINDDIKNKIEFKMLDLLKDSFPLECDLILCRNVMIYFTEEAKEKLYKKFHNALSKEGVFFVGSTEQIIMPQKYGFINLRSFFYQKNENEIE